MKRGPSIAKILDTRNRKAVMLRFDVRAEHKVYQEPPKPKRDPDDGWVGLSWMKPSPKRYEDDLPMTSWMD